VCEACPPGDDACLEAARAKQGFLPRNKEELQALFRGTEDNADLQDQL